MKPFFIFCYRSQDKGTLSENDVIFVPQIPFKPLCTAHTTLFNVYMPVPLDFSTNLVLSQKRNYFATLFLVFYIITLN